VLEEDLVDPGMKAWSSLPALPVKLTSFFGRQHELTELRQRLEVDRLVSLVGRAGIGKTSTRAALPYAIGLNGWVSSSVRAVNEARWILLPSSGVRGRPHAEQTVSARPTPLESAFSTLLAVSRTCTSSECR
jgi:hypothetical protein